MAKKKEVASPFVPEKEQPYPVPGNWVWVRLECASKILNGFAFKSSNYVQDGIRVIRIANVQEGYIEDEKPVYYPLDSQELISPYMLKEDDLLLSLTGNVGRAATLPASFLPAALNQRVACLRVNEDLIAKRFLFFSFLQKSFTHQKLYTGLY